MSDKMTTRGFFRKLLKHVVYGEPNPVTEVIAEGIKHGSEKEASKVIETEGIERHPNDERAER